MAGNTRSARMQWAPLYVPEKFDYPLTIHRTGGINCTMHAFVDVESQFGQIKGLQLKTSLTLDVHRKQ